MEPDARSTDPDRLSIDDEEILDEIFLDMMGLTRKELGEIRGSGDETWGRKTLDQIAYEQGKISLDQRDTLYRAFLRKRVDTLRERLLGARLGSYQIVEEIASGGMGIVFKGRQESPMFTREVAIKFMLSGPEATEDERERFVDEVRNLAGLTHPNLVPIFDSGIEGNLYYFTMELVDGVSLSEPAAVGDLDLRSKVAIIRDVSRALAYLHGNGVVHRDVKPGNIMLDRQGTARLLDFGIAQFSGDARRRGIQAGTPHYMAPEIVHPTGGFGPIGPGADIYALGSVLYFLLYGREVFAGEAGIDGVLTRTLESAPRYPRGGPARIPTTLERVVARCLEKKVEDRYRSAEELADALDRVLERRSLVPWYLAAAATVAVAGTLLFVAAGHGDGEPVAAIDLGPYRGKLTELQEFPERAEAFRQELDVIAAQADRADQMRALRGWDDKVAQFWLATVNEVLGQVRSETEGFVPEGTDSFDTYQSASEALKEASTLPPGRKAWKALLAVQDQFRSAKRFAESFQQQEDARTEAKLAAGNAAYEARSQKEALTPERRERFPEVGEEYDAAEELWSRAEIASASGDLATALKLYKDSAAGFRKAAALADKAEEELQAELARLAKEIDGRAEQLDDAELRARLLAVPETAESLATVLGEARDSLGRQDTSACDEKLAAFDSDLAAAEERARGLEEAASAAEKSAGLARNAALRDLERDGEPRFPDVPELANSWLRAQNHLTEGEEHKGKRELVAAKSSFDDAAAEFGKYLAAVRDLLDEMVWVAGGSVGEESVPGFWIDLHEITVEEYAVFLDDVARNGHMRCCGESGGPSHVPLRWEEQTGLLDRPVVGISIEKALAFAGWAGKALPTPAMWRLAAARGEDGRLLAYPYGQTFDPARTHYPDRAEGPVDLAPARSYSGGESPAGCLHMSGNACEWAVDASGGAWLLGGNIGVREWSFLRTDTRVRVQVPRDEYLRFAGFRCVLKTVRTHED